MKISQSPLFLGLLAIFCWGSLATFGNLLLHMPPFYILGVTFLLGSLLALRHPRKLFINWKISIWGILGYYGYHFFLFYSFRYAPAIEANLINYLWPMLLILLTPIFFPGSKIKSYHLLGGSISLIGCGLLVYRFGFDIKWENLKGYLLAFGAAITWPVYTLGKKRLGDISLYSIGGFCFGAGILSLITHFWIEPRVVLQWHDAWKLIVMGLGPFGVAFYAWDKAVSLGDPRSLAALSYLTPLISTSGLVLFTNETLNPTTIIAMVLIIGGASCGLLDFLPKKHGVK